MSENETVAEVTKQMRRNEKVFHHLYWCEYADRVEAAHKREVAELRECVKEARRELCKSCRDKGFECKKSEPCMTVLNIDIALHKAMEGADDEGK